MNEPTQVVTPEPVVIEPVAPQPAPEPVATVLPTETRDRTREQFEKLLDSNKRLMHENELMKQEVTKRQELGRIFDPIQQFQPMAPMQSDANDFIDRDPITGEKLINDNKLKARIEDINQRATQAERALQSYMKASETREIERQNQEAFSKYPELSPDPSKRDEVFHTMVRGILADSFVNAESYGGRPLSFREAADYVAQHTNRKTATAKAADDADATQKAAAAQAAKQLKEQGSAQANSQPRAQQQMTDDQELESLRYRTRYLNDDAALAERIKHTEHILPREATEV